jgi:hypothetical protein
LPVMKDGRPSTTMSGKWVMVSATGSFAGSKGEGTYTGGGQPSLAPVEETALDPLGSV